MVLTDIPTQEHSLVWLGPKFDTICSDPCTINVLTGLALHAAPKVLVEAGTYLGHMAISLALNLKRFDDDFHVWTADKYEYYVDGFDNKVIKRLGLQDEVTFWLGDFEDMLRRVPPVDFAYIDSSTKDEPTIRKRHFDAVMRRATPGALICVDDCAGDWPCAKSLREKASIYLPNNRGLAIYQKR